MSGRRREDLADLLGAPFLPPPALTRLAKWGHAVTLRWRARSLPPPAVIMQSIFGFYDHHGLIALCDAGVPEALVAPTDHEELATRLDVDPARLELLLRLGVARGWLDMDRRGRFRPNRVTEFLRSDHPGGWRTQVDIWSIDELVEAFSELDARKAPGGGVFRALHSVGFAQWLSEHPDAARRFDRSQEIGGRLHAHTLSAGLDWSGVATVCDVGGGTGALLTTLLELQPHLRGTNLDLPHVLEEARPHERLDHLAGDAFRHVPDGHDVYLLVNVLHMWNDDDAGALLGRVAEAAGTTGVVQVVDSKRSARPLPDMTPYLDLVMNALTDGGAERDAAAIAALAAGRGLRLVATRPLASGDLAHELRPAAVPFPGPGR